MKTYLLVSFLFLISFNLILAQERNTNTFQNSFFDVNIFSRPMIEMGVSTANIDNNNFYLSSSYSINENITFSGEFIDDRKSSQLILSASYLLLDGDSKLAVGPALEFRIGYIGALSAFKFNITDNLESVSKLGFFFDEIDLRELTLSSSIISYLSDDLSLIGEISYATEGFLKIYTRDNLLIGNIGADYKIINGLKLRGSVGYNILDSQTDLNLLCGLSYLF